MARLKCKKRGNVFEYEYKPLDSMVHLGPYKRIQCPACGKSSFFNVYSSLNYSVTCPPQEKTAETPPLESAEEQEKRKIEEFKYEH